MKIALINGSPKFKRSTSEGLLQELKKCLTDQTSIYNFSFNNSIIDKTTLLEVADCDILVFAFPLYVDSIPSQLLRQLVALEDIFKNTDSQEHTVYVITNCGFYEGRQNKSAIKIMKNWCARSGLHWGQGLGIGAGGMLASTKNVPIGQGPKKNLGNAFNELAKNISSCSQAETMFITANFPKFAYKLSTEHVWRKSAKANGLKPLELFYQPFNVN